ncbi:MAG: histidinol phosphate phosphatase domain-containing protein [Deltaproteobacteria bacterium]
MFDLHCHCFLSDGELLPSELVRRVEVMGYRAVAITDHADASNLEHVVSSIVRVTADINKMSGTCLFPGVELTHVHPELIARLTEDARRLGALIVVCHGETIVEPVRPGTNRAAIEAGVDILSHPGLLDPDDARRAAEKGVLLEISGRKGHCLTNGHVAKVARTAGARLVINSDAHAPGDFMTSDHARRVGMGAGLSGEEVDRIYEDVSKQLSAISFQLSAKTIADS